MPNDHSIEGEFATPPIEPAMLLPETPSSRWPTVIGIVSLVYALGGMLCALGIGVSSFFMEAMMAMGGMKVFTPAIIKINGMVSAVLLLVAGVVMLSGSIGTLRRKRGGPKLLRVWAVLRIVLLLVGVVATVLTAPAQIQFQRSVLEEQARRMKEAGRSMNTAELTDDDIWRRTIIQVGIFSGVWAVYPMFLGFYLSRRKITEEVASWP